jgi:uncharacterized membrane protein YfcA
LGAIAGLLAGLLGIGGGLIIVPVLILTFQWQGVRPEVIEHLALGTSLATIIVTSCSSTWEHHRLKAVRWRVFVYLAVGIVVGSFLGAETASALNGATLEILIGALAIVVAGKMGLGRSPREGDREPPEPPELRLPRPLGLIAWGVVVGTVASMFGIGGGLLTVPLLTWCRVRTQEAVGTSAACGIPISVVGALTYVATGWNTPGLPPYSTGHVYWPALLGIVLTSVVFARLGARLAHKVHTVSLRRMFAVLLIVVGIKLSVGGWRAQATPLCQAHSLRNSAFVCLQPRRSAFPG